MNLANKLTIARIIMIPFFLGVIYLVPGDFGQYLAVLIFVVASLTDLLDGYIARSRNLVTEFGKFMDPLADKLLVAAALIYMVESGQLAAWMVIIIISREFIVSGYRLVASLKGDVIAAGVWGKIKTAVTMVMIIYVLLPIEGGLFDMVSLILIYSSIALTVISMVDYMVKNADVLKDK